MYLAIKCIQDAYFLRTSPDIRKNDAAMRLTQWTDYSLRVLMHCAAHEGCAQPTTIGQIAQAQGISHSHLTKIVMRLAAQGLIQTTRGRGGGMRLKRPADSITIGEVVRRAEPDLQQVECFDPATSRCAMDAHCGLQHVFRRALQAYLTELDHVTLADLVRIRPAAPDGGGVLPVSLSPRPGWRIAVAR